MADIRVVRHFLTSHLPEVHQSLVTHEIDLNVIMVNWLVPLFGNVVHVRTLLRIWDLLFFYGSAVILRICLGLFKLNGKRFIFSTVHLIFAVRYLYLILSFHFRTKIIECRKFCRDFKFTVQCSSLYIRC